MPPPGVPSNPIPPSYALSDYTRRLEPLDLVGLQESIKVGYRAIQQERGKLEAMQKLTRELIQHIQFMQELGDTDTDSNMIDHHPFAQEIMPRLWDLARLLGMEAPR